jgi:hypothetical protein
MPKPPARAPRTIFRLAIILVALIAGTRAAPAADTGPSEKPPTSWYGWQTLMADAGAVGLWSLGLAMDDETAGGTVMGAGTAVYAFAAPAIHWSHGQVRKGWGSLGLRVGLPFVGAGAGLILGSIACDSSEDEFIPCPVGLMAMGFLSGFIAAPAVDAAALAREPVTPRAGPDLQAAFVPSRNGGTFVLGGRF